MKPQRPPRSTPDPQPAPSQPPSEEQAPASAQPASNPDTSAYAPTGSGGDGYLPTEPPPASASPYGTDPAAAPSAYAPDVVSEAGDEALDTSGYLPGSDVPTADPYASQGAAPPPAPGHTPPAAPAPHPSQAAPVTDASGYILDASTPQAPPSQAPVPAGVAGDPAAATSAPVSNPVPEIDTGSSVPTVSSTPKLSTPQKKQSVTALKTGRDVDGKKGYKPKTKTVTQEKTSLMSVFFLILAIVVAIMVIKAMIPRDLSGIAGYPAEEGGEPPRNLLPELQEAYINHDKPIKLTEAEVNAYLNHRIKLQKDKGFAKYAGTYVDMRDGHCEIIVVRKVLGFLPFSYGVKMAGHDVGDNTIKWETQGFSFGGLSLPGGMQFKPVWNAVMNVYTVFEEHELEVIKNMRRVAFSENGVTLDPTF